jgi:hypothetical protein
MSAQTQSPNPEQKPDDAKVVDYVPQTISAPRVVEYRRVSLDELDNKTIVIRGFEERPSRYRSGTYFVVYAELDGEKISFIPPARHGQPIIEDLRRMKHIFDAGKAVRVRIIKEVYRDFHRYVFGVPPSSRGKPSKRGEKK